MTRTEVEVPGEGSAWAWPASGFEMGAFIWSIVLAASTPASGRCGGVRFTICDVIFLCPDS